MPPVSRARIRVELLNKIVEISGEPGGPLGLRLGKLSYAHGGSDGGCAWDFRDLKVCATYRPVVIAAIKHVRARFPRVNCPQSPVLDGATRRTARRVPGLADRSISSA
jgi:hypothetical protein